MNPGYSDLVPLNTVAQQHQWNPDDSFDFSLDALGPPSFSMIVPYSQYSMGLDMGLDQRNQYLNAAPKDNSPFPHNIPDAPQINPFEIPAALEYVAPDTRPIMQRYSHASPIRQFTLNRPDSPTNSDPNILQFGNYSPPADRTKAPSPNSHSNQEQANYPVNASLVDPERQPIVSHPTLSISNPAAFRAIRAARDKLRALHDTSNASVEFSTSRGCASGDSSVTSLCNSPNSRHQSPRISREDSPSSPRPLVSLLESAWSVDPSPGQQQPPLRKADGERTPTLTEVNPDLGSITGGERSWVGGKDFPALLSCPNSGHSTVPTVSTRFHLSRCISSCLPDFLFSQASSL
jgi:hypothetical protein